MKFKVGENVRVSVHNHDYADFGAIGFIARCSSEDGILVQFKEGDPLVEPRSSWSWFFSEEELEHFSLLDNSGGKTIHTLDSATGTETVESSALDSELDKACKAVAEKFAEKFFDHDPVNYPKHYTGHPSGIECIHITEHMGFCLGNAVKYIWRADLKNDAIEDLKKAVWYINREIEKRGKK